MLLKAPIHNLTLSLICHFEVNCLHIKPIIGEILLIYINFQPNFPYFSSYDNFYCIEICLPTAYFTSSWCVLKCGFPKFGLFFRIARLVSIVVNAHSQLLEIFGHIAHGRYRARHRYVHRGVDILFLLFPPSVVRPPSSHLVSGHFKEKYLSYLEQIWYGCLLG